MTGAFTDQDGGPHRPVRRITWRVCALALGALALAAVHTVAALVLDAGAEHIGPLWMAAIAWTFISSLAGALWRGFRHRDWSAFSDYDLPKDDSELHEFVLRTGRYSWLREMEDQLLHDDDHLRCIHHKIPRPYCMIAPPLTTTVCPVTNRPRSLARKTAALAMSRGCPMRPRGIRAALA